MTRWRTITVPNSSSGQSRLTLRRKSSASLYSGGDNSKGLRNALQKFILITLINNRTIVHNIISGLLLLELWWRSANFSTYHARERINWTEWNNRLLYTGEEEEKLLRSTKTLSDVQKIIFYFDSPWLQQMTRSLGALMVFLYWLKQRKEVANIRRKAFTFVCVCLPFNSSLMQLDHRIMRRSFNIGSCINKRPQNTHHSPASSRCQPQSTMPNVLVPPSTRRSNNRGQGVAVAGAMRTHTQE